MCLVSPPFLVYSATGGGGVIKARDLLGGARVDIVRQWKLCTGC